MREKSYDQRLWKVERSGGCHKANESGLSVSRHRLHALIIAPENFHYYYDNFHRMEL